MKVNGIDVYQKFNATLLDRNIPTNRVSSSYRWDYQMDRPAFFGNAVEFKDVLLYFKVEADTEEIFYQVMAEMAELFRRGGNVKFDDIKYTYKMYLRQAPTYTKLNETVYRLDFVLDSDYGVTDEKIVESSTNTITINNRGAYPTPARVWITTTAMKERLTITGFDHTIVLKEVPTNAGILIDNMNGKLTINGANAIDKLITYHLPTLPVGTSQISVDADCEIRIAYKERC